MFKFTIQHAEYFLFITAVNQITNVRFEIAGVSDVTIYLVTNQV